jgi:hypothetical protein
VYWLESEGALARASLSNLPMFRPLVAMTAILLAAQGAFELFARGEPLGAVLISVAFLVGSIGATAAPYVAEIERRRKNR